MSIPANQEYMLLALQLAGSGRCTVSPNPMVGCVIVKNNLIVGQGFHERAGESHAEVHALREAGKDASDATVYVTLEPCCHHGRTPPCAQALIDAGVKKVVVACLDPNPLVASKGIKALQEAGIEIEVGVCEEQAITLNEIFFHYIKHKTPFVIAKWAMSLDGKTITHLDDTRNISSSESRKHSHHLREQVDAIIVGSTTVIHDNPSLTVRLTNTTNTKQPIRIILSSNGKIPLDLKIFDKSLLNHTIVVTTHDADKEYLTAFSKNNIEVITVQKNAAGRIYLPELLAILGKREITSVLVEGGMTVHEDFFNEKLVNKVNVYLAPVIIGSLNKKQKINHLHFSQIDSDIFLSSTYQESNHV